MSPLSRRSSLLRWAATLLLALGLFGCTDDDEPSSSDTGTSSPDRDASPADDTETSAPSDVTPSEDASTSDTVPAPRDAGADTAADDTSERDAETPRDTADTMRLAEVGDLSMAVGTSTSESSANDPDFTPFPETGADFELIHGRQGGIHVVVTVLLKGLVRSEFETEVTFEVRDASSGEVLTRNSPYTFTPRSWADTDEGLALYSPNIVFKRRYWNDSNLDGRSAILEVEIAFEKSDQTLTSSIEGTIVDPES